MNMHFVCKVTYEIREELIFIVLVIASLLMH